jgi:HlyD family secretion protein
MLLESKRSRIALASAGAILAALALGSAFALLRPAPGQSVAVTRGEVAVAITGSGTLQARIPVTLTARITAQVVSLHADQGDQVRRGQLLAVLDDRDLAARRAAASASRDGIERNVAAAQANLAKADADLELAQARLRRERELLRAGFLSHSAFDASSLALKSAQAALDSAAAQLAARRAETRAVGEEVRYAETQLSHTRLVAPMDALVVQRSTEVGSISTPGSPLFRLIDPKSIWIAARIDEALVERVSEGMPAIIRLRSGTEHAGRVARISRQSDAATRELDVYVAFDTPPERFAIDQEAEVTIAAGTEQGLVVPVAALMRVKDQQGVMLLRDGKSVFQPVRVTASDGKLALIAVGLDEGARLAAWTSR